MKVYGARGPLSDPPLLGEYLVVLAADAEAHERAAVQQAIRDCVSALPHDTQCIDLWYGGDTAECCCESRGADYALRALLEGTASFPLATGGVISADTSPPQISDGCVLPGVTRRPNGALLEEKP